MPNMTDMLDEVMNLDRKDHIPPLELNANPDWKKIEADGCWRGDVHLDEYVFRDMYGFDETKWPDLIKELYRHSGPCIFNPPDADGRPKHIDYDAATGSTKKAYTKTRDVQKQVLSLLETRACELSGAYNSMIRDKPDGKSLGVYCGFMKSARSLLSAYKKQTCDLNALRVMSSGSEEFSGMLTKEMSTLRNPLGGGPFSMDDILSSRAKGIRDLVYPGYFTKMANARLVEDAEIYSLFHKVGMEHCETKLPGGPGRVLNVRSYGGPTLVAQTKSEDESRGPFVVFLLVIDLKEMLENFHAVPYQSKALIQRMGVEKDKAFIRTEKMMENFRFYRKYLHGKEASKHARRHVIKCQERSEARKSDSEFLEVVRRTHQAMVRKEDEELEKLGLLW